jgi:hypothetical protein
MIDSKPHHNQENVQLLLMAEREALENIYDHLKII